MIPSDRSIRLETGTSSTNLHIMTGLEILLAKLWSEKSLVNKCLPCVKVVGKKSDVVLKGYEE